MKQQKQELLQTIDTKHMVSCNQIEEALGQGLVFSHDKDLLRTTVRARDILKSTHQKSMNVYQVDLEPLETGILLIPRTTVEVSIKGAAEILDE